MKRGVPPTDRKARTGEFTPPGMVLQARSNNSVLRDIYRLVVRRWGQWPMGWPTANDSRSVEKRCALSCGSLDVGSQKYTANDGDAVRPGFHDGIGIFRRNAADGDDGWPPFTLALHQAASLAQMLSRGAHGLWFHSGGVHGAERDVVDIGQ